MGNNGNGGGTNVPVQIGNDIDWVIVDNSKFDYFAGYTLALKSDRSLWSWGSDGGNGALGLAGGYAYLPTRIGTDIDWGNFSAGSTHVVALKINGSLWTWGSSTGGNIPTRIGSDTNWVAVAAGVDISVALKTDGTLWSWIVGESPQQIGPDTDWGLPP